MSELIKKRVSESVSKKVLIFLKNKFRYAGKVTNCDDNYIEIFDEHSNNYRIINISDIESMEVRG